MAFNAFAIYYVILFEKEIKRKREEQYYFHGIGQISRRGMSGE